MQRYFSNERIDNNFILNDSDLYHIKTVMRMRDNDNIEVVFDKKLFICCIENVNDNITIKRVKEVESTLQNDFYSCLIVPVLKEQKMDLILQKATELGVNEIIPYISKRSVIKLKKEDYTKKVDRWARIVKEASEQSKRLEIPAVSSIKNIDELSCIDGVKLICSTKEKSKNLKNILNNVEKYDKINFVIGPEGGLDEKEEEKLISMNFIPITFGERILRVETVPIFLMSVLNYINME